MAGRSLIQDRERPFVQLLGFGEAAVVCVDNAKIVEGCRDLWMICSERLLTYRQRPLVETFGLGVATLIIIKKG
jgi:hypothetical protein